MGGGTVRFESYAMLQTVGEKAYGSGQGDLGVLCYEKRLLLLQMGSR